MVVSKALTGCGCQWTGADCIHIDLLRRIVRILSPGTSVCAHLCVWPREDACAGQAHEGRAEERAEVTPGCPSRRLESEARKSDLFTIICRIYPKS